MSFNNLKLKVINKIKIIKKLQKSFVNEKYTSYIKNTIFLRINIHAM
jgi:hypothetical protein